MAPLRKRARTACDEGMKRTSRHFARVPSVNRKVLCELFMGVKTRPAGPAPEPAPPGGGALPTPPPATAGPHPAALAAALKGG
jgi:hypothetical protein